MILPAINTVFLHIVGPVHISFLVIETPWVFMTSIEFLEYVFGTLHQVQAI